MRKAIASVVVVLVAVLWILSANHGQQSVGPASSTVQAQLTAVAKPTPGSTP